jgi:alpha-1,6-mannosyltransferase
MIVLILIGMTYYRLPWRKLPAAGAPQAQAPPIVEPSIAAPQPEPQPAKPGAYAEFP